MTDFHRLPGDAPERDSTLQPGEVIVSVEVPSQDFGPNHTYLKMRDRQSYAFALVSVAVGLVMDGSRIAGARIALGGVAHKPWRVPEAEELLIGAVAEADAFEAAPGATATTASRSSWPTGPSSVRWARPRRPHRNRRPTSASPERPHPC